MNEERIKEIFSDEVFVTNLLDLETAEEVQSALKEKGLELSVQNIHKIRDTLMSSSGLDELSEAELEEVAGGIAFAALFGLICSGIGALCSLVSTAHRVTNSRW